MKRRKAIVYNNAIKGLSLHRKMHKMLLCIVKQWIMWTYAANSNQLCDKPSGE